MKRDWTKFATYADLRELERRLEREEEVRMAQRAYNLTHWQRRP